MTDQAAKGRVGNWPVVHIGYHKTATTWLQERLFPLCDSHALKPRKVTQDAFLSPGGLHFEPAQARAILGADSPGLPLLLSEENLSGYIHNGGLHGLVAPEMARRIKAALPDAHILMVVRNQFDMCRASYAQYVSGGGTWGQKRYFDTAAKVQGALTRPWKAPVFEFAHFEFDRLVACYDALFGKDRVHVYPYEWLSDHAALREWLARGPHLTFAQWPQAESRANASLGTIAQTLLRGANLLTRQSVVNKDRLVDLPGGQVLRHAAKAMLRRVPLVNRRSAPLAPAIAAKVRAHYPESNRRLIALRNLPLAELGYPL